MQMPKCCGQEMSVKTSNEKFIEAACEICEDVVFLKRSVYNEIRNSHLNDVSDPEGGAPGLFTSLEMQVLKNISHKTPNRYRKEKFKLWICEKCQYTAYFRMVRCVGCESANIKETTKRTSYISPGGD